MRPSRNIKVIGGLAGALALLVFVVFVIAQVAQVAELAARLHPVAGTVVLWTLIVTLSMLALAPVVLFLRLPPPLTPPASAEGPEAERYRRGLRVRLAGNAVTRELPVGSAEELERALGALGVAADELTRKSAGVVFLSTAISQSGRLDAFMVLAELSRLVWRIAHLYSQRPTLREMAQLYGNVAGTAFVASSLDDIDVSEQMAPLVTSVTGGLSGAIPGLQVAASVAANSVLSGAANAFLVLRIGIITRRYCGSLVRPERGEVRRAAAAEAAVLLGSIVKDGAAKITRTTLEATKGKVTGAAASVASGAVGLGSGVLAKLGLKRSNEP